SLSSDLRLLAQWTQPPPQAQLALVWPMRALPAHRSFIVVEGGYAAHQDAWMFRISGEQRSLRLPTTRGGKIAVKAAVMDPDGCIVYGGSLETVVEALSGPPPALQMDMKMLDVPLCN